MEPAGTIFLVATLLLLLCNAFFVAAEFAMVRVRATRLEQLAAGGDARAATAVAINRRLEEYVSANQLGMTLASLGMGWLGEPALAALLSPPLKRLGILTEPAVHGIAIALGLFVITTLHVVLGELAPKTLAIRRTVAVALWTAQPLRVFHLFAWPVIWFMKRLGDLVIRLIGLKPASDSETQHTAEELRLILSRSPAGLDPQIRQMLVRVLDYRRRRARHVMTLAADVIVLYADQSLADATKIAVENRYTRYPVLHPATRKVLGFIHMQDLFAVYTQARKAFRLAEIMREPLYALPNTPLDRLRVEMQSRQLHLAIINSPEGEFRGILTLEDLLEEIVGEIRDESDEEALPIARRSAGVIEVSGRVLLDDLERETGVTLRPVEPEAETVSGYVAKRLGQVAKIGDRIETEEYLIVVIEVAHRRVGRVRLIKLEHEGEEREPALSA